MATRDQRIKPTKSSIVKFDKLLIRLRKWGEREQEQMEKADNIVGTACQWEFAHSMRALGEILASMQTARGDD